MNVIYNIILFSLLIAVVGCSKESSISYEVQPGEIITNHEQTAWCDLPLSAPLVLVGDKILTKGQLLTNVSNEYHALVARGMSKRDIANTFTKNRATLAAQHVTRFLQNSVFLMRADELGIPPDEVAVSNQWHAASRFASKSGMDMKKFACANGHPSPEAFHSFIRDNTRLAKLFNQTFSNRLDVTEKEVDDLRAQLEEGNRISEKTNAVLLAAIEKLRAGLISNKTIFTEDDDENAKKVPEPFKVDWFVKAPGTSFDEEEFVVGKVRYQRPETWSEPCNGDSEISIFYMKEIEQKSSEAPTLFTGFRVYCEKDHGYLVPEKKKLLADMRKRRNIEVVTPEFERLCKRYGVRFPNGLIWRDIFTNHKLKGETKQ